MTQVPAPLQVRVVHEVLSEPQSIPGMGVDRQPPSGSQSSTVQTLPSLQTAAAPPTQRVAEHVSPTVHASPSSQGPTCGRATHEPASPHATSVHGFASSGQQ